MPIRPDNAPLLHTLPPLSLYIHIPYCVKKCPYCDFNSHAVSGRLPEKAYIDALLFDLQQELPHIWGRNIHSIFIGGGTPSVFQAAYIDYLLNNIRALLPLAPECEITMEANPNSSDAQKFADLRYAGVTRLSLGVQSFNNKHLQQLGRVHTAQEAIQALEMATKIFNQVNVDLMYGLPCQTVENAVQDIKTAVNLGVSHISAYQLTIEPNTAFHFRQPENLPDDDLLFEIETAVHNTLFNNGFHRYEISAFASDKKNRCYHNLNYWHFGDYVGIGAGAHGKISYPDKIERTSKLRSPDNYIRAENKNSQRFSIQNKDLPFEFMLNALRLIDGVPATLFSERTGLYLYHLDIILSALRQQGLLSNNPERLQTTDKGLIYLNEILQRFLP
ncbi:MAG: oxygen-independent coproporphyrinogen III oxidase-like protein [Neisseriaceae bacterium]|nr:oxygen-independent coproporphyrinogen III oxidase-like protein [Neisseriaceae bacterium]